MRKIQVGDICRHISALGDNYYKVREIKIDERTNRKYANCKMAQDKSFNFAVEVNVFITNLRKVK